MPSQSIRNFLTQEKDEHQLHAEPRAHRKKRQPNQDPPPPPMPPEPPPEGTQVPQQAAPLPISPKPPPRMQILVIGLFMDFYSQLCLGWVSVPKLIVLNE